MEGLRVVTTFLSCPFSSKQQKKFNQQHHPPSHSQHGVPAPYIQLILNFLKDPIIILKKLINKVSKILKAYLV